MDIVELQKFFRRYADGFHSGDPDTDKNLRLKRAHTFRVTINARKIMAEENFSPAEFSAGEKAALLHDLSRFEQYLQYRTFRDSESFDHGMRSAELAENFRLLEKDCARDAILFAVRRHNQIEIGDAPTPFAQKIAQVVRDADKIDIFRVIFSFKNDPQVTFSLKNDKQLSPEILAAIKAHRPADHRFMRNVADFLAAKIQWVYDLHFGASLRIVARRRLLQKLAPLLDGVPETDVLLDEAKAFLMREIKEK